MDDKIRCSWCGDDPLYQAYHDREWGVPVYDSQQLFEKLMLDGFQAGLSWITILKKRDNFLAAFDNFDPEKMARYTQEDVERLMNDKGIVRNRLKILAAIRNAQLYIDMEHEKKTGEHEKKMGFSEFLWHFTGGQIIQNSWHSHKQLPASTAQSDAMSKALKKKGFKFCGPTICYAFMQAVGMVNDHTTSCFRHTSCSKNRP